MSEELEVRSEESEVRSEELGFMRVTSWASSIGNVKKISYLCSAKSVKKLKCEM